MLGGEFNPDLERVVIDLENVRAVGDAAPGDERTTRDELHLEWWGGDDDGEEEPNNEPVLVSFDLAPPGLYSNVYAEVKHYRFEGKLEADGERDFRIEDEPPGTLAIAIPLSGVTLEAGETRHIAIDVSCGDAVLSVPWDEVIPDGEGDLRLNKDSLQIGGVRDAMDGAFLYQGGGGEVSSGTL
jgi:hypothetical protein